MLSQTRSAMCHVSVCVITLFARLKMIDYQTYATYVNACLFVPLRYRLLNGPTLSLTQLSHTYSER